MVPSFTIGRFDPFPVAQITALRFIPPRLLKFVAISYNQQLDIGTSKPHVVAQPLKRVFVSKNKKRPEGTGTRLGLYRIGKLPDLANTWMRSCDPSKEVIDFPHKHRRIYRVINSPIVSLDSLRKASTAFWEG